MRTRCFALSAILAGLILPGILLSASASTYYVDSNFSGTSTGSFSQPFRTLAQATAAALIPGDTVYLRSGTYRETLTPQASGTYGNPIAFVAYQNEPVIVTGMDLVVAGSNGAGAWTNHSGDIWKIQLTSAYGFGANSAGRNQVAINHTMMQEARWPNATTFASFDRREMTQALSGTVTGGTAGDNFPDPCTYTHAGLAAFGTNTWAGGYIRMAVGSGWVPAGGTISGNGGQNLNFSYIYKGGAAQDTPAAEDSFYLFGRLAGLDSEGECFFDDGGKDGAQYTLYVRRPGGGTPATDVVEMRKRDLALNCTGRSYIQFQAIQFVAGRVSIDSSSQYVSLDHCAVWYGGYRLDLSGSTSAPQARSVTLGGTGCSFTNGTVGYATEFGIYCANNAVNHTISNNVVFQGGHAGINTNGCRGAVVEHNTVFQCASACIYWNSVASRFRYNHCYLAGLYCIDVGIINCYALGDGEGTEVSYNWAHDNLAPYRPSHWNGGCGIRADDGGAPIPSINFVVHHNCVWNTTNPACIPSWGVTQAQWDGTNNYTRTYDKGSSTINTRRYFYHNSVDQQIEWDNGANAGANGYARGDVVRNNIAGSAFACSGVDLTGVTISNNISGTASSSVASGYTVAPAGFVSPLNHNYQLVAGAAAIDSGTLISPYSDGFTGSAPDAGAYERNQKPWIPGATIDTSDISTLTVHYNRTPSGSTRFEVTGMAQGRGLPADAQLRVGGVLSSRFTPTYDIDAHLFTGIFAIPTTASGNLSAELSLDGTTFYSIPTGVNVDPIAVTSISNPAGNTSGGTAYTLQGTGLAGINTWLTPLSLTFPAGDVSTALPLPVRVDCATLATAGKMNADGSDIRFYAGTALKPVNYWVDGAVSNNTLIWLSLPSTLVSLEDETIVYLSSGDSSRSSASSLAEVWPSLTDSTLKVWLKANDLTVNAGDAVASWTDASGNGNGATQATASAKPVFQTAAMNGLPVVRFNGSSHFLSDSAVIGSATASWLAVYQNPTPGSAPNQRIASSAGSDLFPELSGSTVLAHSSATIATRYESTSRSLSGLTIGRRSSGGFFYAGDLAELLCFTSSLSTDSRTEITNYLQRKYGTASASGTLQSSGAIAPVTVTVGGASASSVQIVDANTITFTLPGRTGVNAPTPTSITVAGLYSGSATLQSPFYYYTYPIDLWRIQNFPDPTGTQTAAGSDPDADGLTNLLEYALGSNPLIASPQALPTASLSGSNLAVSFTRAASDVTYTVQVSPDLVHWTDASSYGPAGNYPNSAYSTDITPAGSPAGYTVVKEIGSSGTGASYFMRVQFGL